MLTTVIDEIVLPQAQRFDRDMRKVGEYATADGYINDDDVTKQTILSDMAWNSAKAVART